uniref:Uracil-DNA glycosylase n=1 Tax=Saccoglossus kowalevskii TaxID=10224 RepID=A0ABM0M635_SACKO|nr:PREDICTED: uracil-DNA glycosylase-like [Saccoglossus kowalevskii]
MIGQKKISSFFSPKPAKTSEKRTLADTQQNSSAVLSSPAADEKVGRLSVCFCIWFVQLQSFVESERQKYTVYPPVEQVYTWTQCCDIRDVKVVILGQDPYHGPRQAHGLCFSVQEGIRPPPSLVNMYKELSSDIDGFQSPEHGYLKGWAKQGVLLLNAVLTVRAGVANSHKNKGWETFTDAVISWLNKNLDGVVFLLWGSYAHKKGAIIDKKHHILKSVHPSPLSAHRGYLGCKHFSKANEILVKQDKSPINWKDLPLGN